eukprot:Opistho-2@57944
MTPNGVLMEAHLASRRHKAKRSSFEVHAKVADAHHVGMPGPTIATVSGSLGATSAVPASRKRKRAPAKTFKAETTELPPYNVPQELQEDELMRPSDEVSEARRRKCRALLDTLKLEIEQQGTDMSSNIYGKKWKKGNRWTMNAFMLFSIRFRRVMRPHVDPKFRTIGALSSILSELWGVVSEEEKEEYRATATQMREIHFAATRSREELRAVRASEEVDELLEGVGNEDADDSRSGNSDGALQNYAWTEMDTMSGKEESIMDLLDALTPMQFTQPTHSSPAYEDLLLGDTVTPITGQPHDRWASDTRTAFGADATRVFSSSTHQDMRTFESNVCMTSDQVYDQRTIDSGVRRVSAERFRMHSAPTHPADMRVVRVFTDNSSFVSDTTHEQWPQETAGRLLGTTPTHPHMSLGTTPTHPHMSLGTTPTHPHMSLGTT